MQILELPPFAWALLGFAAVLIGLSKTALPGVNTLSIAIFAAFLPPKESTAALLLLLIVGDIFALISYRRHADWKTLIKLIPAVAGGLGVGALFLAFADDTWVRRAIAVILLALVLYAVWQRIRTHKNPTKPRQQTEGSAIARAGYGSLGGFTTMVANAGGAPMSLYFLSAGFPVKAFLGTAAWFFAIINLVKVPIMASLGLFIPEVLSLALLTVPGVVVGAILGRWIASRIQQRSFEYAILLFTALGAIYLFF
ncbi:sulfite exporter TauE/SafE family protein [Leucobacter denitrificans]|uniref:Probable membrane transporter protein n=1 Tax=Leucobacter denitrificans TaxID=683042 RepID=A0A7G9S801_9MICO|nr:sulfite exporter TauE/SafE family protein [Leucobacter denitrificans]QNN63976.1 sulfite exporter TauE/SafE family protein [Leucobacter denitrificans]